MPTSATHPPHDGASASAAPGERDCSAREGRAILAVTILGSAMTFIDGSVVNVVLPELRRALDTSPAQAQWVVEAYMLFLASLLLVGGALGDRWGRRRVFVLGTMIFAAASAACGLAANAWMLIAARAVQGIGAALLVPGSLALISTNFSSERRGRAIGTWASVTSIAGGAGPVVGAWLVELLSWRWIFFINLPAAAAIVAIAWWRVPESDVRPTAAPLDWPGALLVTGGLFAIVLGLTEAGTRGAGHPLTLGSLLAGVAALAGFIVFEGRSRTPMVHLAMFRSRTFTGVNLLTLFLYAGLGAMMFTLPFNLIEVRHYSLVQASSSLLPFVVVMFGLSRWAGGLMDRYGPRLPLTVGPSLAAAGFLLFAWLDAPDYVSGVLPAVLVLSLGMGITVAPLTAAVMSSAGERDAGVASGINNAVSRVATLLSVACLGLVVSGRGFGAGLPRVALMGAGLAAIGALCAALLVGGRESARPT
ncbi:MAG TPA: MFS transporter [Gemmatimonadales bacterium]|nr:MFS transporter [Gemmatimonadales bacterium]